MRTIRYGCKGDDVKWLQYLLNQELHEKYPEKYELLKLDGHCGTKTKQAIWDFQNLYYPELDRDYSCGPKTRAKIGLSDFMVLIFDPKKDKIWVAGTPYGSASYPLKTLKQWATEEQADIVANLAFFNRSGKGSDMYGPIKGRTLTYVRGKGKDIGYGGTAEQVIIDNNNKFAGYKVAIKDGKFVSFTTSVMRARNANGILTDGRFFVVQSLVKATEYEIAKHMKTNYNVKLMLTQDSGGSTGLYFREHDALIACEKEGANGRPVATVVCICPNRG